MMTAATLVDAYQQRFLLKHDVYFSVTPRRLVLPLHFCASQRGVFVFKPELKIIQHGEH